MLRRVAEMFLNRPAPPDDERSIKDVQLEQLRDEVGRTLDRVDRITPAAHRRLASYHRVRIGR